MGVKISNLPIVATPALSDVFPIVQAGVTYQESFTQLSSLFATAGANSNITSLSGLTTPLSIAQGGTGSATGDPTFDSVTFSPSTKGIVGTTTNNNAAAGFVGEFVSSVIADASAVAISTNTATNLTSISLTAGDWDTWGNIFFFNSLAAFTAMECWISSTSATQPDPSLRTELVPAGGVLTTICGLNAPYKRFSLASTTTIYLTGFVLFGSGTSDMRGGIYARRAR